METDTIQPTTMDAPPVDAPVIDATPDEPITTPNEPINDAPIDGGDTTPAPAAPTTPAPIANQGPDVHEQLRIANNRAEAAEARAEARQEIYQGHQNDQQQRQAQEVETQRIMNMTPEERLIYTSDLQEQRLQEVVLGAERRIEEANDRAEFVSYTANNPVAQKLKDEVEAEHKKAHDAARARGDYGYRATRKDVLTYLAGEKALAAGASTEPSPQRVQAQQNLQNSQAKSTTHNGDAAGTAAPADSKAARNDRLKGGKYR